MIFVSYRRSDSADVAGRIYDHLQTQFGREMLFKDVDSIPAGMSFVDVIRIELSKAKAVLALIGPTWLTCADEAGAPRLFNPADFVRLELETALAIGVRLIPVLVTNARMPTAAALPPSLHPLLGLNGLAVRPDPDFHKDMERLVEEIRRVDPAFTIPNQSRRANAAAADIRTSIEASAREFCHLVDFMNEGNALILGATEIVRQLQGMLGPAFTPKGITEAVGSKDPRLLAAVTTGWYNSPLSGKLDGMHEALRQYVTTLTGGWSVVRVLVEMLTTIIRDSYATVQFHRMLIIPPSGMWVAKTPDPDFVQTVTKHLQGNSAMYYAARYEHATKEMKQFVTTVRACQTGLRDEEVVRVANLRVPEAGPGGTRTKEIAANVLSMLPIIGKEVYDSLSKSLSRIETFVSKEYASRRLSEIGKESSS